MAGHREFQKACHDQGVVPILGNEVYFSPTDRFDKRTNASRKDGTSIYNHLTVLAQDAAGWQSLSALSEEAWRSGYYHKPRADLELFKTYSDGLIVLSGCLNGPIAKAIDRGDEADAVYWAETFKDIFGERFLIEVQAHNPPAINHGLLAIADKLKIRPVMASDCHYAKPEDLWAEEAMLILSTSPDRLKDIEQSRMASMELLEKLNYLYPDRKMSFQEYKLYMRSLVEEQAMFEASGIERKDIYENTNFVASMVGEYEYHSGLDLLPMPSYDPQERLESLVQTGAKKLFGTMTDEYSDRLTEELTVIRDKSLARYFLVLEDMVSEARRRNIMIGPGRGSGAGSLVNYCLGITSIDPIKYNLLFARFLDPERDDPADVDIDVASSRRNEIKHYMELKFKHVAGINTFGLFKDKNLIKDACRVMCVPLGEVQAVVDSIETFDEFLTARHTEEFRRANPDVVRIAKYLHGRIRQVGMHAGGLVVSNEPLSRYVPIETRKDPSAVANERIPVVALDMGEVEKVGLIKIDFLGLKTLSVIQDTLDAIKSRTGKDIDLLGLDLEDKDVYEMLSAGQTVGVFQCMKPDQKIHTINGVKSAGDIAIGDSVLTHAGRFMPVTKTMNRKASEPMYEIVMGKQMGRSISLTGEHPVLISDSKFNMKWTKASEIVAGRKVKSRKLSGWNSYVVVPKTSTNSSASFGDIDVDEEFARFLGLYLAEGFIAEDGRIDFTFHKDEIEYHDFVADILSRRLGLNPSMYQRDNVTHVRAGARKYFHLFRNWFGHGAKNKIVPPQMFSVSKGIIRSFLVGYAQGDGKIDATGHVAVQTASENLAWGLKALVANIGSYTNVGHHTRTIDGYGTYDVYTCSYHIGERKLKRVLENDEFLLMPIKEVICYDYDGPVVNFEVDGDNSYVSEFVLHNCEAPPYTKLLMDMGLDSFHDLVASNALVRPGAANTIGKTYIARKQGRDFAPKVDPVYDSITADTYGVVLYQEQVMLLCRDLAGLSWGDANKIRRIIGKKKDPHEFEQFRQKFVTGAAIKVGEAMASQLWSDFEAHAAYSFNASHAVAYSTVSYWTAWLKRNYPLEFMFALLRNESSKQSRANYLLEAKRLGLKVLLPHVNDADVEVSITGDRLMFGLADVKYISEIGAKKIMQLRPFSSYADLTEKAGKRGSGINRRAIQYLDMIGAAEFPDNPVKGNERDNFYEVLGIPNFSAHDLPVQIGKQLDYIESFKERGSFVFYAIATEIKKGSGWSRVTIMDSTGSAGIFHTDSSQIQKGKMYLFLVCDNSIIRYIEPDQLSNVYTDPFLRYLDVNKINIEDGKRVVIAFATRRTKAGQHMGTAVLAKSDKEIETALVFPKMFSRALGKLKPGSVVEVKYNKLDDGGLAVKEIA